MIMKISCGTKSAVDHIIFSNEKRSPTDKRSLLYSHGSAGLSDVDLKLIRHMCSFGFDVIAADHFSSRGVQTQWWHDLKAVPAITDRKADLLEIARHYNVKGLIGISAGGTACLMAQNVLNLPVFSIYPSLYPITESMAKARNATIITGILDDWTPLHHAKNFAQLIDANLIEVDGYHGFLIPQDVKFLADVISLRDKNDTTIVADDNALSELNATEKGVHVGYSEIAEEKTYQHLGGFLNAIS